MTKAAAADNDGNGVNTYSTNHRGLEGDTNNEEAVRTDAQTGHHQT